MGMLCLYAAPQSVALPMKLRQDASVGRDSVEPPGFAFFLTGAGVVAAAVLSGRLFRSAAGDGGSYISGERRLLAPGECKNVGLCCGSAERRPTDEIFARTNRVGRDSVEPRFAFFLSGAAL